ncbi:MAG TPA: PBP1A family penicillin-binding protein [Acidimicrobiales bacterium]
MAGTRAERRADRRAGHRRSILWRWRRLLFLLALLGIAGVAGAGYVLSSIPLPPERTPEQTSFICGADVSSGCGPANAIAELHAEQDRVLVDLDDVPGVLVDAVLAAEDRDFFDHGGIDPFGIARAAWADIRDEGRTQGGSTITQQYVKNVYLSSERTLVRKLKEAVLAVKLERELGKDEILERYLNTVYFGRGAYGVGAAARAWFGKPVDELGLAESAYLAGLIRAPESADFSEHPDEATRRRRTVLDAMVQVGTITRQERDQADAVPWTWPWVMPKDETPESTEVTDAAAAADAEYFVEAVRRYLSERYGDARVYGGGLRVYTTIDLRMQQAAVDAVASTLDEPGDPAAALVAVDDGGFVRAMVGGNDFATNQVNLALGRAGGGSGRQPGSTFKAVALAEAVREGYSVLSTFEAPAEITIPEADAGGDWDVENYDQAEYGTLDLVDATRLSANTVYAQLMVELGAENVVRMAHDLGVTADLQPNNSLVLGGGEVSVLDMATAFSTLANEGVHRTPVMVTRVETADGQVLESNVPSENVVLTPEESAVVTYCLRQVIADGTGVAAAFGKEAAGKTGTTSSYRDAWFVGYTPKLTAAVWMGYPDPDAEGNPVPMLDVHGRRVTGGSFPAEMWRAFMEVATEGMDTGEFREPEDFQGVILNEDLRTTTTEEPPSTAAPTTTEETLPPSTEPPSTEPPTTETIPPPTTGTTLPPTTVTLPPTTDTLPPTTDTTATTGPP